MASAFFSNFHYRRIGLIWPSKEFKYAFLKYFIWNSFLILLGEKSETEISTAKILS